MKSEKPKRKLVVAGVSFKTSDLRQRSRFAFNSIACTEAYAHHHSFPFFILSTCNRTEIYAWVETSADVLEILKSKASCTDVELRDLVYTKESSHAVDHLFRVTAGLESQIVGDYDVVSQVKTAARLAKESSAWNGTLEKLFNFAMQTSKEIKNETSFSDGTVSVPYAVIRKLMERKDVHTITVVGAGETGELVIKYIRSYLPQAVVRLVNRDEEKLHAIGGRYDVLQFPMTSLRQSVSDADVLIVATNAEFPIVDREHIEGSMLKMIFDLSVPRNVGPRVYQLQEIDVFDVDRVSDDISNTINLRRNEIPKAEGIIAKYVDAFHAWMLRRSIYSVDTPNESL